MVFNSVLFLVFFPVVLGVYFLLPLKVRWAWLLVTSLTAVASSGVFVLLPMVGASALAYFLALRLEKESDKARKKRLLTVGIVIVVGSLAVFKYSGFANETLRSIVGWSGAAYPVEPFHLLLPVGISFYTFQLIAYLVDVYRGARAERHAGLFLLYVAFFPKFVAGPIERARKLLPQLHETHRFAYSDVVAGLQLMTWGGFKKVVVADRLAPFVRGAYDAPQQHDGVTMVFATVVFAFQVYCDFSGYSDMAIGAARTFGIRLSPNFNRPYTAVSVQDFWKRWHISLTTWLTDYVYTPLTRTRKVKVKWFYLMLVSLFVTFVVSGLWHGAQWTFILWGALHGTYLVISVLTQKWRGRVIAWTGIATKPRFHRACRVAITFALVCLAYVLFGASTVADAAYIYAQLGTGWSEPLNGVRAFIWPDMPEFLIAAAGVLAVLVVEAYGRDRELYEIVSARPVFVRWAMYYAVALAIVSLGAFYGMNQQFIYFQF